MLLSYVQTHACPTYEGNSRQSHHFHYVDYRISMCELTKRTDMHILMTLHADADTGTGTEVCVFAHLTYATLKRHLMAHISRFVFKSQLFVALSAETFLAFVRLTSGAQKHLLAGI